MAMRRTCKWKQPAQRSLHSAACTLRCVQLQELPLSRAHRALLGRAAPGGAGGWLTVGSPHDSGRIFAMVPCRENKLSGPLLPWKLPASMKVLSLNYNQVRCPVLFCLVHKRNLRAARCLS